jgi:predicted ATPase
MLKRIYIDNYKCFSNFEYTPGQTQLIIGVNGTGKTALLSIIRQLRALLVDGTPVADLFEPFSLTRWDSRREQTIEFDLEADSGLFTYKLVVHHPLPEPDTSQKSFLMTELLYHEGSALVWFVDEEVELFTDEGDSWAKYPADNSRSIVSSVPDKAQGKLITQFKRAMHGMQCFSIDPRSMMVMSDRETSYPSEYLVDFVSWYRHLCQEDMASNAELQMSLSDVIDGFSSLSLARFGRDTRWLFANFRKSTGQEFSLSFGELSDGQRCLVALYSILYFSLQNRCIVCLDEPDNFVALSEIQPWIMSAYTRASEAGAQLLVISHHPELIDYMADTSVTFYRNDTGPVRVHESVFTEGLSPSETVARGWEGE